ncbi:hypothetical protein [Pseudomonas sp. LjRoot71]|uniref:hypothetical protein n=1 Tax=Pseudomonas sp. LjRoot71 TaxID=3342336 RepID=UPI003F4F4003
MDKLENFPEIDYRFYTLNDYINEIAEFLEFTYAQKIQRIKAKIPTISAPVEQGELAGELCKLEENGLEYLSHTIWGGVLVSIFGTYESSIQELMTFFEETQGKPKFKKEGRKSLIECADIYSREHLKTRLYRDQADKLLIDDLAKLRNSYVHNGCSINLLPTRLREAVVENKYRDYSLGVKNGKWLANSTNSKLYFKYIHDSFQSYRRRLADLL